MKVEGDGCNNEYDWGTVHANAAYDLLNQNVCDIIVDLGFNDGFSGIVVLKINNKSIADWRNGSSSIFTLLLLGTLLLVHQYLH